jgi:hypothetical protein
LGRKKLLKFDLTKKISKKPSKKTLMDMQREDEELINQFIRK